LLSLLQCVPGRLNRLGNIGGLRAIRVIDHPCPERPRANRTGHQIGAVKAEGGGVEQDIAHLFEGRIAVNLCIHTLIWGDETGLRHPDLMRDRALQEADEGVRGGVVAHLREDRARAQNWLRQEKSYRAFGNELGRDATPVEADLPRFIDLEKDFHGKDEMVAKGVRSKCCTLLIDGPADADPWGREVLYTENGVRVGRLTSGGYSVAFEKSIGMGYVKPELAVEGTKLKVKMQDRLWDAVVTCDSPYDPKNTTIRQDG